MPSSVSDVFASADLLPRGGVRWGTKLDVAGPGVYVVALPDVRSECPISASALDKLLRLRPELSVDGDRPSLETLAERISGSWLPDEVVLYVGLAGTSLRQRCNQYYRTGLGKRSPHAGGWFLKTLSLLPELRVFYAACVDPSVCESTMLTAFGNRVSATGRSALFDQLCPIPFANLKWSNGRKRHGIKGAKEARVHRDSQKAETGWVGELARTEVSSRPNGVAQTQRVTHNDIVGGRIRIPRQTKALLGGKTAELEVDLRGERFTARWDPRLGPPERSGVLGAGRDRLRRLIEPGEVLVVDRDEAVVRIS